MIQVRIEARNGVSLQSPKYLALNEKRFLTIRPRGVLYDFEYLDTLDRRKNPPLLQTSDNLLNLVDLADYYDLTVYEVGGTFQMYLLINEIISMEDTFRIVDGVETPCVLIKFNEGAFSIREVEVAGVLSDFVAPLPFVAQITVGAGATIDNITDAAGTYDATIDWGDGSPEEAVVHPLSHTYVDAGDYDITIKGKFSQFYTDYSSTTFKTALRVIKTWGNLQLETLDDAFPFSGITDILEPLTGVDKLTGTFFEFLDSSTDLVNIPERLFSNCINVGSLWYPFYGCSSLVDIPENILWGMEKLYHIEYPFYDGAITKFIPGLLKELPSLKVLYGLYGGVSSITDTHAYKGLIAPAKNTLIHVSDNFLELSSVVSIDKDFYRQCPNITIVGFTYSENGMVEFDPELYLGLNLTRLNGLYGWADQMPETEYDYFFANNFPLLKANNQTFVGNTNLIELPAHCLDGLANVVELLLYCGFASNLTTVPHNLFYKLKKLKNVAYIFRNCTSLVSVDADLFSRNPIEDFSYAFYGCTGYTGAVPELWISHPDAKHTNCFTGCTSASNYASIPNDWKGL